MSNFSFIVDNIVYSYSSVSTYRTCAYSFKLGYVDALSPKEDNFFAEYGTLVHNCLEKYFSGELEAFQLSSYYSNEFNTIVKSSPPPGFPDMLENYKRQGQYYFDNFIFDKRQYDIIYVEDQINFTLENIQATARPDLILKNIKTQKISLCDYKTAVPFRIDKRSGKETVDKKKMDGYYKQMYLYAYALRQTHDININVIDLWFPRADRRVQIPWKKKEEKEALAWFQETVEEIKKDKIFYYNNTNSFFCNNLCSVRKYCEYR